MIRRVLALIQTLLDIMRLRKGPDSIPHSQVVLLIVIAMWVGADLISVVASPQVNMDRRVVGWLVSFVALAIFALVVSFYGRRERLLQMISAIVGCAALFTVVLTIIVGMSGQATDDSPVQLGIVMSVFAVMLWSVIVEGHILARTIEQPRIVGVMISLSVFLLQLYLLEITFPAMNPEAGA